MTDGRFPGGHGFVTVFWQHKRKVWIKNTGHPGMQTIVSTEQALLAGAQIVLTPGAVTVKVVAGSIKGTTEESLEQLCKMRKMKCHSHKTIHGPFTSIIPGNEHHCAEVVACLKPGTHKRTFTSCGSSLRTLVGHLDFEQWLEI